MDFDNEFYKQWKSKSINNRNFFDNKLNVSKGNSKNDNICSSAFVQEQSETETFSLRLSESCVDEIEESDNRKLNEKDEVILISDSSSNGSIFSYDKSSRLKNNVNIEHKTKKGIEFLESCQETIMESPKALIQNNNVQQTTKNNYEFVEKSKPVVVIDESDPEIDENKVPKIIKNTVIESATLSERKKKEIMQWLLKNVDNCKYETSFSQESAISNSRKSYLSSGNSSLERLELNFETPNNRGKLKNQITVKKTNQNILKDLKGQSTLDQYFTKVKKNKLNISKDTTPKSKVIYKTPINNIKVKTKTKLLESNILNYKKPKKNNFNITPIKNMTTNLEISENESSEEIANNNLKINTKAIIIPETQILESTDYDSSCENMYNINYKDSAPIAKPTIIPESVCSEVNDDLEQLNSSLNMNLKNKDKCQKNITSNFNSEVNNIVDECADILENLYGATWRKKASTLISATEPKKQRVRKIFKNVQTEKKGKLRYDRFDLKKSHIESDNILPSIKNHCIIPIKKRDQPGKKKLPCKVSSKNTFTNNESTTESSPDCSYYTAVTNPTSLQNNQFPSKNISTQKIKNRNNIQKVLSICDSDSDCDNENWKNRPNYNRKLSFSSSSSSITSEFDPGDVVLPKTTKKGLKITKAVNLAPAKPTILQENKNLKKSFLASLSKDVPLENADFKAMTYRVKYNTMKEELCKFLFKLFNENVFDNKLPDNMSIEWSVRLRGTAGKCYNKQSLKALGKTVRSSRIVLATKILDSPDRLRDTLIHEMCHAATWLINSISDGHGSFWKAWADKAMKTFPELPPISRCHNYEIQTKYTYKCKNCSYSIGRHSKSLDINKKRCGYCHGSFELLINKVTKAGKIQAKSTAQTKGLSGFALYVKENYHLVKQTGVTIKHGEVMKILGQQFSAIKLTPKTDNRIENNENKAP